MGNDLPLGLGGHTFIEELGNDPPLSHDEAVDVVEACLDNGVTFFDTTYTQERVRLGDALHELGRRDEATIVAWNFFGSVHSNPIPYKEGHIDAILSELRTDFVDRLVVHPPYEDDETATDADHQRGLGIAEGWVEEGLVGELGTWWPGPDADREYGEDNPFSFMVQPYNVDTEDAAESFAAAKRLGWETVAVTPFVRGWKLDEMVAAAGELSDDPEPDLRSRLADHMLRYSLFQPDVDRLVVGMRKVEWVGRNVESVERGPLSDEEEEWLFSVADRVDG